MQAASSANARLGVHAAVTGTMHSNTEGAAECKLHAACSANAHLRAHTLKGMSIKAMESC